MGTLVTSSIADVVGGRVRRFASRMGPTDVVAVIALAVSGAALKHFGRHWTFFYDEWQAIAYRRHGGLSTIFAPHNGHLLATDMALDRVLFATVGLRSYAPYQGVVIAGHLILGGLVYLFGKQRVGGWAAVLAIVPLLVLADAWQVLFWATDIQLVLPMIALLVCLLWPRPAVVGLALTLALASSGLGVAIAVAVFVLIVRSPNRRPSMIAWSIPVAAYGLWWIRYRNAASTPADLRALPGADPHGDLGSARFPASNVGHAPSYIARSAKATADSLTATGHTGGWWTLTLVLTALTAGAVVRRNHARPLLLPLAIGLIVFWTETAITRGDLAAPGTTGASRYLYPAAVLIVLLAVETFAGLHLSAVVAPIMTIAIAAIAVQDVHVLHTIDNASAKTFAEENHLLRRACDPAIDPTTVLDPLRVPGVTAAMYRAAVHELGTPSEQRC